MRKFFTCEQCGLTFHERPSLITIALSGFSVRRQKLDLVDKRLKLCTECAREVKTIDVIVKSGAIKMVK